MRRASTRMACQDPLPNISASISWESGSCATSCRGRYSQSGWVPSTRQAARAGIARSWQQVSRRGDISRGYQFHPCSSSRTHRGKHRVLRSDDEQPADGILYRRQMIQSEPDASASFGGLRATGTHAATGVESREPRFHRRATGERKICIPRFSPDTTAKRSMSDPCCERFESLQRYRSRCWATGCPSISPRWTGQETSSSIARNLMRLIGWGGKSSALRRRRTESESFWGMPDEFRVVSRKRSSSCTSSECRSLPVTMKSHPHSSRWRPTSRRQTSRSITTCSAWRLSVASRSDTDYKPCSTKSRSPVSTAQGSTATGPCGHCRLSAGRPYSSSPARHRSEYPLPRFLAASSAVYNVRASPAGILRRQQHRLGATKRRAIISFHGRVLTGNFGNRL